MTDEMEDIADDLISSLVPEAGNKVKLNVNGSEEEVDESEVIEAGVRALQKESAGEEKLKLAADRNAELDAREEKVKELELSLARTDDDIVTDIGKEFSEAIFDDEDKVASVISSIDSRLKHVEDAEKAAAERNVLSEENEKRSLARYYHKNHKEIATDPDLHAVFNARIARVATENPEMAPTAVIDQVAKETLERFAPKSSKEKQTRQPSSVAVRNLAKKEDHIPTDAEVIEEMRGGRARPY